MSNSSIEGRLKGLEERIESEIRNRRENAFHSQGGLGAPRTGSGRRPKPLFSGKDIPAFPPRTPHNAETENRMREVYKVSGKLNVGGVEYRSHIDELQHLGELGSGTCGHVVKMLHKPSAAVIAVKQMRRSGNSEETKRILMDLDVVVRSHDCPYIVRCLGCFVTDADVWICMELMATCFDKLLKRIGAPIPEVILGKVTVATVNALSYLKDTHGVIHRDVKPSNILLDERGNVKLCDFGISGRLVDSKAKTRSAGCAAYMAPERIDPPDPSRPDYDIRADVWSLGISLVELATGVFPYRDCQNDFEVLTRVIEEDPPKLPEDEEFEFTNEFKSFVSQCLTKNYRQRPKYVKLLEHPFVVKSTRATVSVGDWYQALPLPGGNGKVVKAASPTTVDGDQPVNFVTSAQHWIDQVTPQPQRAWWAAAGAGSSSQPASLEADCGLSPFPRRRTLEPPARRVSVDARWRPAPAPSPSPAYNGSLSPAPSPLLPRSPRPPRAWPPHDHREPSSTCSSGNTSPIVLQRFHHQINQRRSRADQPATPRHRSLSREHSTGRSPEPPPRSGRRHHMLGHDVAANGSSDEPPPLHERLHPPSPLLLNDRLSERVSEGRSQSLTRAELRNGHRPGAAPPPARRLDDQGWLHSLAGLVKRRLSGYVRWQHSPRQGTSRWGGPGESWSVPGSPLPPRAPPARPAAPAAHE